MLWKTFAGRCLKRTANEARVYDNWFFRWLTFDSDALQTVLNKRHPEKAALNYINVLIFMARKSPGNSCMLGLGGGAIAHSLSPFLSDFKIYAVENSEEVINLASQYFMTDSLPNLEIIHAEASVFVSNYPQPFKHLMVDLFNAESFPATCYNDQFFYNCKRLLLPDGILAVNLANGYEQRPIFEMIRKQFSSATIAIPVKNCNNLIVIAIKNQSVTPLLNIFKHSKQLKKLTWDETWGCVAELKI